MNVIPWGMSLAVFTGTLPIFGLLAWNLIEVKGIRAELIGIHREIANIRERLAILEERDRLTHPVVVTR